MLYVVNNLEEAVKKSKKTYVIIGNPRGGTTMISGLLAMNGVKTTASDDIYFEDVEFIRAREPISVLIGEDSPARNEMLGVLAWLVEKRNKEKDIWGWKDPLSMFYAEILIPLLVNPIFIFIWRDPLAIAFREKLETGMDEKTAINLALDRNDRMRHLLNHTVVPALHCSFEKAKENKRQFLSLFCEALNFEVDETKMNKMIDFIKPGYVSAGLDLK